MAEMKDSGIKWVGEIPKNWEIVKIKYYLERMEPRSNGTEQVLSVYRDYGVIPKNSRSDNHNVTSSDTSNYKHVDVGNLVINKMKAWQGSMAVSNYKGIVSPAYYVYRFTSSRLLPKYLNYLVRNCYKNEFRRLSTGIREGQWDLQSYDFENTKILLPSISEQQAIVDFLDHKCADIDKFSGQIQKEIDSLQEYRKSVITKAVTKGLNENVPMKDSGIEWIGEIPQNWKMIKGKYLFDLRSETGNRITLQLLSPTQKFGVIPQKKYEELTGMRPVKLKSSTNLNTLKTIHKNDFCISLRSFEGGFEFSNYEGVVSPAYQVFYTNKKHIAPGFYKYLFKNKSFIEKMNSYTMSLRDGKNISFYDFGRTYLPMPPFSEQCMISDYLDQKTSQIDKIISEKKKQLSLLSDYKNSLIFQYVTGKKQARIGAGE